MSSLVIKRAPHSSSFRTVSFFRGAIHVLAVMRETDKVVSAYLVLKYITPSYAVMEASENPCSWSSRISFSS